MYSSHKYKRTFITSKYDTVYYYSVDSIDSEVGWKCYTFSFKSIMTFYKTHNSSGENFQIYKISSFSPHCNIPIHPCKLKKKYYTLRYNCINRRKKKHFTILSSFQFIIMQRIVTTALCIWTQSFSWRSEKNILTLMISWHVYFKEAELSTN